MDTFELATVVVAGTALVLAPIDPQPIRDLNSPVPASTWVVTFDEKLARRVQTALGFRRFRMPNAAEDETEARIGVWSQDELNDLYERVGGIVSARTVERSPYGCDSTWNATEVTVTVDLPGIGIVEVFTDWEESYGGRDLSVMQQIPDVELIAN